VETNEKPRPGDVWALPRESIMTHHTITLYIQRAAQPRHIPAKHRRPI